jgi:hypothetical protein
MTGVSWAGESHEPLSGYGITGARAIVFLLCRRPEHSHGRDTLPHLAKDPYIARPLHVWCEGRGVLTRTIGAGRHTGADLPVILVL